jgi:phage terminase large subunit GpA-like protein
VKVAGLGALTQVERVGRGRLFAPPPRLTASEWAERYRRLSTEVSATGGQWRSYPWQREPMDLASSGGTREMVIVWPSQVAGKTEILLNLIGYSVDLDPCPMLIVEPTLDMARDLSKDRIDPMFRESPRLRGLIRDTGRREKEDTILKKAGPGWRLALVGANSPAGLAMRPVRKLFLDEVDRYPPSAGEEGDPAAIAERRTATFPNRLIVRTGSPSEAGRGIWPAWLQSDQRLWMVPCPHCGHQQSLEWGGANESFGLKWERDADGHAIPETAAYLCAGCGALIEERYKHAMNAEGRWVPQAPGRSVAGFRLTALVSERVSWAELIRYYVAALHAPEQLRVFQNTLLALPFDPPGEQLDVAAVTRERWGEDEAGYPVAPQGVACLTMGVDVQGDRLEVLVQGWGPGEEGWLLGNWRLQGDPMRPEVWAALEALRTRAWAHESGAKLRIIQTAVDSGAWQKSVLDYVVRARSGVIATKGSSELLAPLLSRPGLKGKRTPLGARPWLVGTVAAKDVVFTRLQRVKTPGPGYVHVGHQIDDAFLTQLGSERRVYVRRGTQRFATYEVIGDRPNEAIDLLVLALVALYSLGEPVRRQLDRMHAAVLASVAQSAGAAQVPEPGPVPLAAAGSPAVPRPKIADPYAPYRPRGPGWVDRW